MAGGFVSVTRTSDELSLVVAEEAVPRGATADGLRVQSGWRCLKVAGPLDFSLVGILASLAVPLAEAGVSIFAISTFDTDYLLVPASDLARAVAELKVRGHRVAGS